MIQQYDDQRKVWWRHHTTDQGMLVTEYSFNGVDWIMFSSGSVAHIQGMSPQP